MEKKLKNKETGQHGEALAANYLKEKGWTVLGRNWVHHPWELDIVIQKEDWLVFVEVKTMAGSYELAPELKANRLKWHSVWNAAKAFLTENPFEGQMRFDLIYVLLSGSAAEIKHYEDVWIPNNYGR